MRSRETVVQRIINGISVVHLIKKGGDLMSKVLIFGFQLLFMLALTFYAAANSATVDGISVGQPQGGIMFLYGLAIGSSWVLLLVLLQLIDDRNIIVAGKFPLMLVLLVVLILCFLGVIIGSIVSLGAATVGAGVAIGYFVLTWLLTELIQAVAVLAQYQLTPKRKLDDIEVEDDEYADARGTFQGVDESIAVGGSVSKGDEETGQVPDDEFASLAADSAAGPGEADESDLGLL